MSIVVSEYSIHMDISSPLTAAVASDLHDTPICKEAVSVLTKLSPDMVLIPGDLFEEFEKEKNALSFLTDVTKITDVYYSLGNHDRVNEKAIECIKNSGVVVLDDDYIIRDEICICGLTSGITSGRHHTERTPPPNLDKLSEFTAINRPKILLSHHPEYYKKFIRKKNIDLTVSGHAHGGQWRIFGRGIYAPGQGLFPKYTSGVHEGRLVVSRGLGNLTRIPRIFNPPEIVFLNLIPKKQNGEIKI
ncbi:MAG: metallophosphoesterase [Clostridia bacterium]|nr:metallophosphoesterase [Clostridia bacterium]